MIEHYNIPGTKNLDNSQYFNEPHHDPRYQERQEEYKTLVKDWIDNPRGVTTIRFGDGDYYVLTKHGVGSASPGRRALGKPYSELTNHQDFIDGVPKNDYVFAEIMPQIRTWYHAMYPERYIDNNLEYIYGYTANRWIFEQLKGKKIGLIGAGIKLDIIKKLMEYQEYQNYLGVDKFYAYINIPQKFAMDDVEGLEQLIETQLNEQEECDFYMFGIGHVKLAVAHKFKHYKDKPFLDIGCGIDAIAGCINTKRPYYGSWTNFRMPNYNYSGIDYLNYNHGNEKLIK